MPTDSELLAQVIQNVATLNQKFDMFMQYYKDRHEELAKRVDKNEERIDEIEKEIKGLHNSSMQFLNDLVREITDKFTASMQDLERRIFDKIEANSKFSTSNWIMIGIAAISSLIGIGGVVIALIALFR